MKIPNITATPDFLQVRLDIRDVKYFDYGQVSHLVKDIPKLAVIEHPGFELFEKSIRELKYPDWSYRNLLNKGYGVSLPITKKDDKEISFFFILSEKAEKAFLRKFSGISNKYNNYAHTDFT